jgi:hypothetical protein
MSDVKNRPQHKPCITCNQQKPDGGFYWYAYITQQGKPSVRRESRCLECARQRRRDRYARDPVKDQTWSLKWKTLNNEQMLERQAAYKKTYIGKAICNASNARRQAAQLQRSPLWANLDDIQKFYDRAAEAGLTVDHVIPLQGVLVSGLHVSGNLQLLSAEENSRKKNSFDVA